MLLVIYATLLCWGADRDAQIRPGMQLQAVQGLLTRDADHLIAFDNIGLRSWDFSAFLMFVTFNRDGIVLNKHVQIVPFREYTKENVKKTNQRENRKTKVSGR